MISRWSFHVPIILIYHNQATCKTLVRLCTIIKKIFTNLHIAERCLGLQSHQKTLKRFYLINSKNSLLWQTTRQDSMHVTTIQNGCAGLDPRRPWLKIKLCCHCLTCFARNLGRNISQFIGSFSGLSIPGSLSVQVFKTKPQEQKKVSFIYFRRSFAEWKKNNLWPFQALW